MTLPERTPFSGTQRTLTGRTIYAGQASGQLLVTRMGISFFGGIDPDNGRVVEKGHELYGQCVAGKILAFPSGKGSTVGSYTLYRLKANGLAPAGIVNTECETITAVGCIIAEIPCLDHIPLDLLQSGQPAEIIADQLHLITTRDFFSNSLLEA